MSFVLNRFVDALSKFNQRDDSDKEWPVSINTQAAIALKWIQLPFRKQNETEKKLAFPLNQVDCLTS